MAKKNAEEQQKGLDKPPFAVTEPPKSTDARPGRKGPTVPPLRIKVDKNDEKQHYVIENNATAAEKLSITVKLSDTGAATIKAPGKVQSSGSLEKEEISGGEKAGAKAGHLGLFSGLPQNEPGKMGPGAGIKAAVTAVTTSQAGGQWIPESAIGTKEDNKPLDNSNPQMAGLKMPPASEPANVLPQHLSQQSTTSSDMLKGSKTIGYPTMKGMWESVMQQQQEINSSHLPPHLQKPNMPQPMAGQPQRPSSAHQDVMAKRPPSAHQEMMGKRPPNVHKPRVPERPPSKGVKLPGLEINTDMPGKLAVDAPGLHQVNYLPFKYALVY